MTDLTLIDQVAFHNRISAAADEVERLAETLDTEIEGRNREIRAALAAGVPVAVVADWAGLTPVRIRQIRRHTR